jgi:hypothetical protein
MRNTHVCEIDHPGQEIIVCTSKLTYMLEGGSKIILKYAGKDATQEYDPIHPPDAITTNLPPEKQ